MEKVKRCATCEHSLQRGRAWITCKEHSNWVERTTIIMSRQKYIIARLQSQLQAAEKEGKRLVKRCNKTIELGMDIQRELDNAEAQLALHRWIPVEERLPEETGNYQVILPHRSWPENRMYYGEGEWQEASSVTYWKSIILPVENPE